MKSKGLKGSNHFSREDKNKILLSYFSFADEQFKCSTKLEEVGSGTLSAQ